MSPVAQADGHDMPGLAGEPIPGITAVIDDLSGRWIGEVHARRPVKGIVLDMDSSVSPTFGST